MDEATLERHLHLTMTLIGGFMGGYAILNRHDVFGSAQTGNMLSLQWMPFKCRFIHLNHSFS